MSDQPVKESPPVVPVGDTGTVLAQPDFVPLSLGGWGDGWNAYTHSMRWFNGALYCGTFRGNFCLKYRQQHEDSTWPVWPIRCPKPEDVYRELDLCAEIWRFDGGARQWNRVQKSPMVAGKSGEDVARECGYRGMAVFQGRSDTKPTLYVGTYSYTGSIGPLILRSEDGSSFEPTIEGGMGIQGISSFRFLVPFNDRLYTSPVGATKRAKNYSPVPVVFESDDPARGTWRQVSEPGFGDPDNAVVFNVVPFNGHLYAGTFNHQSGLQLWKARMEGSAPYEWKKVLDKGAGRGRINQGVLALCEFKGALYVGTCIQDGGYDRVNRVGPAAGEIIRVYPDDTWDLVVGDARVTREGLKTPTSGFGPGFNDFFNGYMWQLCVHGDRLYLGTFNYRSLLQYADRTVWPPMASELVDAIGEENLLREAGFDIWSTGDGDRWEPLTTTGFGNPCNIGARTVVSTPIGLAIGSANPLGPQILSRAGGKIAYEDNVRGGTEVWIGAPAHDAGMLGQAPGGWRGEPQRAREGFRVDLPLPPEVRTNPYEKTDPAQARSLPAAEIDRVIRATDPDRSFGQTIERLRQQFNLLIDGVETLPQSGAVLYVCNSVRVQLSGVSTQFCVTDMLASSAIRQHTGRSPSILLDADELVTDERVRMSQQAFERLGYVTFSAANALQLLERGQSVLLYAEQEPSEPPYKTGPFRPEFDEVLAGWKGKVVPMVFIGPHESHLIVHTDAGNVLLNRYKAQKADYRIDFLPPADDCDAGEIRSRMQERIDFLVERRPQRPYKLLRRLQREFGAGGKTGELPELEEESAG